MTSSEDLSKEVGQIEARLAGAKEEEKRATAVYKRAAQDLVTRAGSESAVDEAANELGRAQHTVVGLDVELASLKEQHAAALAAENEAAEQAAREQRQAELNDLGTQLSREADLALSTFERLCLSLGRFHQLQESLLEFAEDGRLIGRNCREKLTGFNDSAEFLVESLQRAGTLRPYPSHVVTSVTLTARGLLPIPAEQKARGAGPEIIVCKPNYFAK